MKDVVEQHRANCKKLGMRYTKLTPREAMARLCEANTVPGRTGSPFPTTERK
jgi:hypothetical protein